MLQCDRNPDNMAGARSHAIAKAFNNGTANIQKNDNVTETFLGVSAFPKKLSPQQIPVSVDLEDPIVELMVPTQQFILLSYCPFIHHTTL